MSERFKVTISKVVVGAIPPWVQIPPSPNKMQTDYPVCILLFKIANYIFTFFIIFMDIYSNDISFQARAGKNVLKIVKKEFNGDKIRTAKFEQLFEDTFAKNLDENTIIDLDKNNKYIFSHPAFPKIKHKSPEKPVFKKSFANSLLTECPKILGSIEIKMLRTIIAKSIKSGRSFEDLENFAQKIFKNEKSKENFLENLNLAKRIKKEYPKSKLKDFEFDYMLNVVLEEQANTTGTEMYNLVHNFGGLTFE